MCALAEQQPVLLLSSWLAIVDDQELFGLGHLLLKPKFSYVKINSLLHNEHEIVGKSVISFLLILLLCQVRNLAELAHVENLASALKTGGM